MARPRGFQEREVLLLAADAFVAGGFEGTSIDDLVKALGLHRGSLYKAFGSKHGLFLAALALRVDGLRRDLGEEPPTTGELDLLLVAALERGREDPRAAALVHQALWLLDSAAPPAGAATTPPVTRPRQALGLLDARLFDRLLPPEPDYDPERRST